MIARIVVEVGAVCSLLAAAMSLSGCAVFNPNGFEFGAKAGMYAVDERHDESRTLRSRKPIKCYLWGGAGCSAEEGAVSGS